MTLVYTRRVPSKKSDNEEGVSANFEKNGEKRATVKFANYVAKGF